MDCASAELRSENPLIRTAHAARTRIHGRDGTIPGTDIGAARERVTMARTPDRSLMEVATACARLKRALGVVQCALFDLHEAFLEINSEQQRTLEREALACLERIRAHSRPHSRA